MTEGRTRYWALPLLVVAFSLRVWALADLQVYGDSAWSVYLALKDLSWMTSVTAMDSHPPLHYYLLHFWMGAAGVGELPVRFLSAFTGLLTVAVTFRLGQRLLGTNGGLLAGGLVAVSPFLIYFDRMPRMYSLLVLLATLSLYLSLRLLASPSALHLGLYLAVILAALYTHYHGTVVVAAGFLAVAVGWRRDRKLLAAWVGGHLLVGSLYLPWLLYALGASLTVSTQAYSAMDLAPPASLPAILERFWIALNLGGLTDTGQSRLLALGLAVLWAAGISVFLLTGRWRHSLQGRLPLLVPAALVALPILINASVFLLTPYMPFTRYLLFAAPAYLLLLAWVLRELWGGSRLAGALGIALAVGSLVYALPGTFYVEGREADLEAAEASRRVALLAGPEDGIIFQAPWHAGYFRVRQGGQAPQVHSLQEVPLADLPRVLEKHPRLWLSMLNSSKRMASYPQEEWLDRNAFKAQEWWQGRLRLSLYGGGPDPSLQPLGTNFGGLISLEAAGLGASEARAGEVVNLLFRWRALSNVGQKYVVFAHLVDAEGRRCTGRDSEPVDELSSTETWKTGDIIDDRRGLLVEPTVPSGQYRLAVGLYARNDPSKRLAAQGGGETQVLLGPLKVLPSSPLPGEGRAAVKTGLGLDLLGYRVDPPWERRVTGVSIVDGQATIWAETSPGTGDRLPVTVRWQATEPLSQTFSRRLELVDNSGKAWGHTPLAPLGGPCTISHWVPGEVVSDTSEIDIQENVPPGEYRLRATLYSQQGVPLADPILFGSLRVR